MNNKSIYRNILYWMVASVAVFLFTKWITKPENREKLLLVKNGKTKSSPPSPFIQLKPIPIGKKKVDPKKPDKHEDDLKIIDGIGPKSESALKAAGITTFSNLAKLTPEKIQEVLSMRGVRISKTDTWPEQASKL